MKTALSLMLTFLLSSSFAFAETAKAKDPVVLLKTSKGDIQIQLNPAKAPKTVENFLMYVKSGQYEGTLFHRVIDGFMIQGGGLDKKFNEKPTKAPIQNEANNGLINEVGTVAMARTRNEHSATAQFFINVADNAFLNHTSKTPEGWGYAVFGKVIKGMDVVNMIKKVATGQRNGMTDVPKDDVVILKATIQ